LQQTLAVKLAAFDESLLRPPPIEPSVSTDETAAAPVDDSCVRAHPFQSNHPSRAFVLDNPIDLPEEDETPSLVIDDEDGTLPELDSPANQESLSEAPSISVDSFAEEFKTRDDVILPELDSLASHESLSEAASVSADLFAESEELKTRDHGCETYDGPPPLEVCENDDSQLFQDPKLSTDENCTQSDSPKRRSEQTSESSSANELSEPTKKRRCFARRRKPFQATSFADSAGPLDPLETEVSQFNGKIASLAAHFNQRLLEAYEEFRQKIVHDPLYPEMAHFLGPVKDTLPDVTLDTSLHLHNDRGMIGLVLCAKPNPDDQISQRDQAELQIFATELLSKPASQTLSMSLRERLLSASVGVFPF
jgi:hypothetical protein